MTRTDEAEAFFRAVYSAVQEIPFGKVTSYGHIAKLIGTRTFFFSPFPSLLSPSRPVPNLSSSIPSVTNHRIVS